VEDCGVGCEENAGGNFSFQKKKSFPQTPFKRKPIEGLIIIALSFCTIALVAIAQKEGKSRQTAPRFPFLLGCFWIDSGGTALYNGLKNGLEG